MTSARSKKGTHAAQKRSGIRRRVQIGGGAHNQKQCSTSQESATISIRPQPEFVRRSGHQKQVGYPALLLLLADKKEKEEKEREGGGEKGGGTDRQCQVQVCFVACLSQTRRRLDTVKHKRQD